MELKFKVVHGTMENIPNGVFSHGDKTRVRKNAHKVNMPIGDEIIEMWEYEERVILTTEYVNESVATLGAKIQQLEDTLDLAIVSAI